MPHPELVEGFGIAPGTAVVGLPLLSRDSGRYRTYFPTLEVIAPE